MSQHTPKSYSYEDSYHVLGLSPDCEWSDVRLAYKKLIQKWHPDRYIDKSAEKVAADDKIKSINIAYHQLSAYYRKNKSLPSPSASLTGKNTPKSNPADSKPKEKNPPPLNSIKKPTPIRQPNQKNKKSTFKGTVFVIFLAGLYFISSEDFTTPSSESFSEQKNYSHEETNKSLQNTTRNNNEDTTPSKTDDSLQENSVETIEETKEEQHVDVFFSNGSSMGDVVLIQGVPTKTENNTWYYGKSEVHFHEGKVTHWIRSTENPLRAQLNIR